VTTVLTMTTLMASTNAALPKISYVKSIDVYLGACFFMVFASLLGERRYQFLLHEFTPREEMDHLGVNAGTSFYNMRSPTGVNFGPQGRSWPLGGERRYQLKHEFTPRAPRGEVDPLGRCYVSPRGEQLFFLTEAWTYT
jgi:hypothetical protein